MKKLINIIPKIDNRPLKWLVALDYDCLVLKPELEKYNFKLVCLAEKLSNEKINQIIFKQKINLLITTKGWNVYHARPCFYYYGMLSIDSKILVQTSQVVKAIVDTIFYIPDITYRAVWIDGQYITSLPKIKKQHKLDKRR